jgi:predicted TIM-barrel fold metal-dependent hydrolase
MTESRPPSTSHVDELVAIDIHTHPQTEEFLEAMGARRRQMGEHFQQERRPVSFAEQADMYRDWRMMAVLCNSDDETVSGVPGAPNHLIGDAAAAHPDVFIPFAGIDPHKGRAAIDEIRRCHEMYGIRGVGELNPARQKFYPNDRAFYPIWETCQELGLVVMFHMGFAGAGAGKPGGMGYKLDPVRAIPYLDDVAADFPELNVIHAHPGWPFHSEALAACWHKSNFYIDLSGFAPRYFPDETVHYANSLIQDRVLFGTDWPVIPIDRWMREFEELPFKDTVRQKILKDNARRLFGI